MKRWTCLLAAAAAMAWGQEKQASEPPVKNVELTVYLLSGATVIGTPATDDVPQDLAATVKQLHSLFTYKSYKLAESFILRGRSNTNRGGAHTEGVLPGSGVHYNFGYQQVRVSAEKPYMVHIDSISMNLQGPPTYGPDGKQRGNSTVGSIGTDLDLVEGQKVVVGKSSINSNGDALILVIVPKVIE
jgi:hypothetical protein